MIGAMKKPILALGIVILFCFVCLSCRDRWYVRHRDKQAIECLILLHKSWLRAGKPEEYDVTDYLLTNNRVLEFHRDTNGYLVSGVTQRGLFSATWTWNGKPRAFIVTREGTVYQKVGDRLSFKDNDTER